jgi:predicted dehydrogenase
VAPTRKYSLRTEIDVVRCRVGLVGAGNVARRHAQVLAGFHDVEIVGVADPDRDRAEQLAAECGAPAFGDHDALLAAEPDAVYVCVPPFAHGAAESALVGAGRALFVEKPLALDYPAAQRIHHDVRRARAVTAVGHHWRYLNIVEQAQALLAGRAVRLVAGSWLDKLPPVTWWPVRAGSGGQVVEQAVHVLDLSRLLVGEVSEVSGVSGWAPPVDGADVDGATAATMRFANGAVGTLAATCLLGWKHRAGLEIYTDDLALTITENELVVCDAGGERLRVTADQDAAKRAVDRAFVDAVRGLGTDVRAPYEDALRSHRLACAVAEAVAQRRPVRLDAGRPESAGAGRPSPASAGQPSSEGAGQPSPASSAEASHG